MISFEVTMQQILAQRTLSLRARDYIRPRHCDNCAGDIPVAYVAAVVYHENVFCCSGFCVAELLRVWAPKKRSYPVVPVLVALLLAFLSSWR